MKLNVGSLVTFQIYCSITSTSSSSHKYPWLKISPHRLDGSVDQSCAIR